MITRRVFSRTLLLGAVGASIPMVGCDWVAFLAHYIPVINGGIGTIETFFGAALPPGVSSILDIIKAALADIGTACSDYEAAPTALKATILGKIEVFLKGIVDGFQQLLDNFASLGPVPGIILGIINIVVSTLEWLVGKFSTATTTRMLMPMSVRLTDRMGAGNQYIVITPIQRTEKQFKLEINTLMASNGRSDIVI